MRLMSAFLLLLLPASLLFPLATPLQKFLAASFEPDQAVVVQSLAVEGSFVLVIADGNETYVLEAQDARVLSDKGEISALLVAHVKNTTGYYPKLNSALQAPGLIASSKEAKEKDCMRLTGTDMHDCIDKATCIYACKSNPNCDILLYSDGFWEAVLDWTNSRKAFAAKLSAYSDNLEAAGADPSVAAQKAALLSELSLLAQNISQNALFLNRTDVPCSTDDSARCYEYCPKINYSAQKLDSYRQALLSLQSILESAARQPARADAILASGRANGDYLASRAGRFEQFRVAMASEVRRLNATAQQVGEKVNDNGAASRSVESLADLSSSIADDADSGYYRRALSRQAEFNSSASAAQSIMNSALASHAALLSDISALEAKVNKSRGIIGKSSAAGYYAAVSQARNLSSSQPTPDGIEAQRAELSRLSEKLTDEIAEKATQLPPVPAEVPTWKKVAALCPCLPAGILLILLAFAAGRRI